MANRAVGALRRYLVAGLLIWLPIGATVLIFGLLLDMMDQLLFWLPDEYYPRISGRRVPGLGAILAFATLLVTGIVGANFFGKRLVAAYEHVLSRIPLVRSVYGAVKHFAEMVFSESGTSFKKVILIEYPRPGLYSLAFQTSDNPAEVQSLTGETVITVFLPTTPNPTSGFMLFVPKSQATELQMSVEDALKMIVSLGVVVPKWHPAHPDSQVAPTNPST